MKKQLIALTIFITSIMICCNQQKKYPQLFIKTVTATGVEEKQVKTDTITEVNSDYFEVGLYSLDNGTGFSAQRDIEKPTSIENFKFVFFSIVQEDGNDIKFKSSTEFLNFMSERGYEMVDQVKRKYHNDADYTFKKKK